MNRVKHLSIAGLVFLGACSGSSDQNNSNTTPNLNSRFENLTLPVAPAPAPIPAAAPSRSLSDPSFEFTQSISSSEEPGGKRDIGVDCSRLIKSIDPQTGALTAIATVSFVSLFDATNSPAIMNRLTPIQRQIVTEAALNRSTDANQINFMVGHVEGAHGVTPQDISTAGNRCKSEFSANLG